MGIPHPAEIACEQNLLLLKAMEAFPAPMTCVYCEIPETVNLLEVSKWAHESPEDARKGIWACPECRKVYKGRLKPPISSKPDDIW